MRSQFYVIGLIIALITIGCEKVIDVPLNEADQRIVVEGELRNATGVNYVKLSKSGSVYDDSGFEKLSGAVVKITDMSGTEYVFTEVDTVPGMYTNDLFLTEPNNVYSLYVEVEGNVITSSCVTNGVPVFDQLFFEMQENLFGSFFGSEADSIAQIFFEFSDEAVNENYYRIKAWVNGGEDGSLYLFDDALFNGSNVIATLFSTPAFRGDTVMAELISMDKANYDYLFTLYNANDQGGVSPANPISNLQGDPSLGYFGAFTVDTLTLIIPL